MMAADIREALGKLPSRPPAPDTVAIVQRKTAQLRELGVEFVSGSDEGTFGQTAPQATWRELDAWVRGIGVDPMTAIRKATLDAARHVGADRESGSVGEGKFADPSRAVIVGLQRHHRYVAVAYGHAAPLARRAGV